MSSSPDAMFGEISYASVARRLGALAVDYFASLGIAVVVFREFPYGTQGSMLATIGVFFVEIVIFTFLLGASFGQKLLAMRVVNNFNGGRLSLWRIMLRTLLILLVIPALVMDSDGRGLHDRIVGSRVIRVVK